MLLVDIVTGASQGIGRAIAEAVASQRAADFSSGSSSSNYLLVLTGRHGERGAAAAAAIGSHYSNLPAIFEPCHVSDYADVVRLKGRIAHRAAAAQRRQDSGGVTAEGGPFAVGVLVNCAGECPRQQQLVQRPQLQDDGRTVRQVSIDTQFATNVLGYHFMMRVFQDHLLLGDGESSSSHVVNIASNWAGDLDLDDLHFQRRTYDNDTAYRQSKQCDRMLTVQWAERLRSRAAANNSNGDDRNSAAKVVTVNACHPGDPCTTLSRALGYNLWSRPPSRRMIEVESPILYLCGFPGHARGQRITAAGDVVTGKWFEGTSEQPRRCQFAGLHRDGQRLFDICESFAVNTCTETM